MRSRIGTFLVSALLAASSVVVVSPSAEAGYWGCCLYASEGGTWRTAGWAKSGWNGNPWIETHFRDRYANDGRGAYTEGQFYAYWMGKTVNYKTDKGLIYWDGRDHVHVHRASYYGSPNAQHGTRFSVCIDKPFLNSCNTSGLQ